MGVLLRTELFLTTPWTVLLILVFQNLMGMYINLWFDFSRYSSISKAFASFPVLNLHVAVGALILMMTMGRFILGFQPQFRAIRTPSILLFIFGILAFGSGVEFTFFGHNDLFSFTMELGFGGIVASTGYLIFITSKQARPTG